MLEFFGFFKNLDLFSLCSHQVLRRFLTCSQSLQMYSPKSLSLTWFCTILQLTHSRFGIYTYNMSKTIYSHNTANVSCSTFMLAFFELWASNQPTSANMIAIYFERVLNWFKKNIWGTKWKQCLKELPGSGFYIFRRFKESLGSRS